MRVTGLLISEEPRHNVQPGDQNEKIAKHSHIDTGPIAGNRSYISIAVIDIVIH
jgi:hypothetical protein